MKKIILLPGICLCLAVASYGQTLTKKESSKILETALADVKKSDTSGFIKLWVMDGSQWPYHGGQKFSVNDIKDNYQDFKAYFDSALVNNLKFAGMQCDTIAHDDPHYEYAKYYIKAWFKYSSTHTRGFGFYMDYVNNQWLVRYSPDYLDANTPAK